MIILSIFRKNVMYIYTGIDMVYILELQVNNFILSINLTITNFLAKKITNSERVMP